MRKTLIALAAGLMTLSALPAASSAQERPYTAGPPMQDHGNMNHGDMNRGHDDDHNMNNGRHDDMRWGRWDNGWGARPGAPPRHWGRTNDWYRHAHACQVRYRSYNPRTDMFRSRTAWVRCRL